jgi:hypothetical protein
MHAANFKFLITFNGWGEGDKSGRKKLESIKGTACMRMCVCVCVCAWSCAHACMFFCFSHTCCQSYPF